MIEEEVEPRCSASFRFAHITALLYVGGQFGRLETAVTASTFREKVTSVLHFVARCSVHLLASLLFLCPSPLLAQAGAGTSTGGDLPEPRQVAPKAQEDLDPALLEAQYVDSLELLAQGDRHAAVEALGLFEQGIVEPAMKLDAGLLWEVESQTAIELAHANPEVLVPILMLHHDVSGWFQERRIWHLARRSAMLSATLAERYAETAGSEGARVVAARTYASLGGYLHQVMATRDCRCTPLYKKALDYDSDNAAALLGLGMVFEKANDPLAAVAFLRRLVEIEPRNREAALRLAINQRRGGWRKAAEKGLDELTRADGPEWVVALAFQELTRIYIDRDDRLSALEVLERGRARLPANQALAIQHAFLLERARDLDRAAEVLEPLRTGLSDAAAEARARYNSWPRTTIEEVRATLWEGAESRLPMLAERVDARRGSRPEVVSR